jgi:hypothetical protein
MSEKIKTGSLKGFAISTKKAITTKKMLQILHTVSF